MHLILTITLTSGAFDTAIFEVSGKGLRGDIHTISEDHDFWYVLKMLLERAGLGHFDDEASLFHLPAWIPYNSSATFTSSKCLLIVSIAYDLR